jgi:hypothetical protein
VNDDDTTTLNPLEQLAKHYAGKWKFIVHDKPKPDYVSAPYEEGGIGTITMIQTAIADAGHRFKAFTVTVRQSDHPNLFEFTLKQIDPQ